MVVSKQLDDVSKTKSDDEVQRAVGTARRFLMLAIVRAGSAEYCK